MSSYLITCSGSKMQPPRNISTLDDLSFPELKNYRLRMIEYSRCILNWEQTLPAWQLYSGNRSKFFPQVTVNNWTKSCVKVKILSALFGWINHTDLIPYYDLKMDQKLVTNNSFVFNIWNQFSILESFIDPTDIDLLSINYRKAISKNNNLNCIQPNIRFTDRGVQKGKWLNAQLELISCR